MLSKAMRHVRVVVFDSAVDGYFHLNHLRFRGQAGRGPHFDAGRSDRPSALASIFSCA